MVLSRDHQDKLPATPEHAFRHQAQQVLIPYGASVLVRHHQVVGGAPGQDTTQYIARGELGLDSLTWLGRRLPVQYCETRPREPVLLRDSASSPLEAAKAASATR